MPLERTLVALGRAAEGARQAAEELDRAVAATREAGATWAEIGGAVGVSRQAAHQRWGHIPGSGCQRRDCDCPDHAPRDCACGHGPGRGHHAHGGARCRGKDDAEPG